MVQFNFATSIAIVALLVASVSSIAIPVKTLDINKRDINELRSRNAAEAVIKDLAKFFGRLKKSKAGHVAKHVNNVSGYVNQPQQQQQQPQRRRDLSAQLGRNLDKRDILDMEERGWGYHDLGLRGYFDENN
ncbi:hypothetical protein APHAL10511_008095 [Amanita phalloides]|nr:hypothetical protein APHAL10511_008095 [Amanita phalloides]